MLNCPASALLAVPMAPPALPPAGLNLLPLTTKDGLDWRRIAAHLDGQGLSLDADFVPRRFAGGLANFNYLVRLADATWAVLRRPPDGPLPPGANDMAREHRILTDLWRKLPVAPRSLHLCTDESIAGAPFLLLEFRAGITVRGDSMAPLPATPETGATLSRVLVEGLAAIHGVDPVEVGLAGLGRPRDFLARNVKGWTQRAVRVCGAGLSPALHSLAAWLEKHAAGVGGDGSLLHNDFKLDNLVLDRDSLAPVAVLDWDMGTRGDALFDLGTLLSYWSEPGDPDCMHRLAQMPTAKPGFLSREEAAAAYARHTGRALDNFKVYRVMGMFKLGIVFHQLHSRYRHGEVADARYAGFGKLADEILHFTQDIADDRIF